MAGNATLYIDESGDLGWKFDSPYLAGGSSRYLTIAGAIVADGGEKHLNRLVRDIYTSRGWNTKKEKKWSQMKPAAKMDFANRASSLSEGRSGVSFHAISVYKPNVADHIRFDGNKLYNYMIGLLFLRHLQPFDNVLFIPDERSVKVASGNSLHDYLQTKLWFDKGAATNHPQRLQNRDHRTFTPMAPTEHHLETIICLLLNLRNEKIAPAECS